MKRNRLIAISVLLGVFLLGMAGLTIVDAKAAENVGQDRLIGILVTTRHLDLFDEQSYMRDTIDRLAKGGAFAGSANTGNATVLNGDTSAYEGRLYAMLTERTLTNTETGATSSHKEYVFEGIDGIPYFSATITSENNGDTYVVSGSDAAISDGNNAISITDVGTSVSLEGIVYVATKARENFYYFNPVFQSSDGRVFATSGQGLQIDGEMGEGATYSQKLDASHTVTENGKVKTDTFSIKISISIMHLPERIVLIQMDNINTILSRNEYMPGQLPKTIVPDKEAAYIVTETHKKGPDGRAIITRKLTGREAKTLESFWAREDGICVKQFTELSWQE